MKTFEQCCREVAEKMWPHAGQEYLDMAYDMHTTKLSRQAAHLYAQEKLKVLLEEVREMQSKNETEAQRGYSEKTERFFLGRNDTLRTIANRIEELIEQPTTTNQSGN